jgi:hypothetical protein
LKDQLIEAINHAHKVSEVHVFVAICRGLWDRMGKDVLSFLENRKENKAWYKGARVAVSVSSFSYCPHFTFHKSIECLPCQCCFSLLLWPYKHVMLQVLDDTFASQMQQLLGNTLQQKDLEPPRSIMEVRSILCKDAPRQKNSSFYY